MKTITVAEALDVRNTNTGSVTKCATCKHSYKDVEEGELCRKYDAKIKLSSGAILDWPGQATAAAIKECKGTSYEYSFINHLVFPHGGAKAALAIVTWAVLLTGVVVALFVDCGAVK